MAVGALVAEGPGLGVGVTVGEGPPMPRSPRLPQVHVQNAALAGGVVVGTASEMMLTPFGALAAGFLAGTVSTMGYKFFTVQTPPRPGQKGVFGGLPPPLQQARGGRGTRDSLWVSCPPAHPGVKIQSSRHMWCPQPSWDAGGPGSPGGGPRGGAGHARSLRRWVSRPPSCPIDPH